MTVESRIQTTPRAARSHGSRGRHLVARVESPPDPFRAEARRLARHAIRATLLYGDSRDVAALCRSLTPNLVAEVDHVEAVVLSAIQAVANRGQAANLVTVCDELLARGQLAQCGGEVGLIEPPQGMPLHPGNIQRDAAVARQVLDERKANRGLRAFADELECSPGHLRPRGFITSRLLTLLGALNGEEAS